jgi:hypothetical protein
MRHNTSQHLAGACLSVVRVRHSHAHAPARRRVAAAIREAGLQGQVHPTDYLQFFCLGKREADGSTWPHVRRACS